MIVHKSPTVGLLMGDVNRVTKDSDKTSVISAILVFFTVLIP